MAICGGVNCMLLCDSYVQLCKARMLSPTGQSHTFSDKADGYTRAEGCGVVILKRLQDVRKWAVWDTSTANMILENITLKNIAHSRKQHSSQGIKGEQNQKRKLI